jgi:uncharacterized protein (DUF983 family)
MANPMILGASLGRLVRITCPQCGQVKLVTRVPNVYRICPRCHLRFADPLSARGSVK